VHPGQKLRPGARVQFGTSPALHGEVLERRFYGRRIMRLWTEDGRDVMEVIEEIGHVPLPPYIRRLDAPADRDRYQTIYARATGSVAAPTAGLHFTGPLLEALRVAGVDRTEITLHVGYGTFKPVRSERVEDHIVDPEPYVIGGDAAAAINGALDERRRIVVVGTTTTRALESAAAQAAGRVKSSASVADLFIYPGFTFRVTGALLTNFHLPRSSLLMLVSAFAGRERVLDAYREAIARAYRFYSYGDAMLIV
jgi:S-adenosylmethionine:tRNA ribosyltransferase-isomerase